MPNVTLGCVAAFFAGACVLGCSGVSPAAALTLAGGARPIAVFRRTGRLAFSAIELAKVFGRLADPSPIGSVLATPSSRLGGVDSRGQRKWRGLFLREDEQLDRVQFAKRLGAAQLEWPTYYVANRQPPFLVPEKQRHKFKLKGYLGHVVIDQHRAEDAKDGPLADFGRTLKSIARQPLDRGAVDSVFMALSHEEERLAVNHILAFIKYRSPLLQMVNWEAFLASLPVGPEDIPI
ncbi:signal peptide containing protein [Babesia caballi]|uniref:Signal peptide containing protein n=1 Tax=Babesia caballi TaxID=5871 RepID=A0AAV4M0B6_BABCB|nr:signal peptide containing protein [Babesia caballi]